MFSCLHRVSQIRDNLDNFTTAIKDIVNKHTEIVERKKCLDEAAADDTGSGRYPAKLAMDGLSQIIRKLLILCETNVRISERAEQLTYLKRKLLDTILRLLMQAERAKLQM